MTDDRRVRPTFAEAVALAIVLLYQWSIARTLVNGAFVDEATYIVAGRALRAGTAAVSTFATYFSGAPFLYPPLAALADTVGGLSAARDVSAVLVWIATLAVFAATRRLFASGVAAVGAAALFAVSAPAVFLARLATYDAASLALLAIAFAFASGMGSASRARRLALGIGAGVALGLAGGAKYAALLYAPTIGAVVALAPGIARSARARAFDVAVVALTAIVVVAVIARVGGVEPMARGFVSTTLTRAAPSGASIASVLSVVFALGGAVLLVALPALALRVRASRSLVLVLVASALLAPINHARLHEMVSLHKHVAFALLFAAPTAGATIGAFWASAPRAIEHDRRVLATCLCVAAAFAAYRFIVEPARIEAARLYTYWPSNTDRVYATLAPIVTPNARILDEEPDLGPYYLGARSRYAQWSHPYFFRYDGAGDGTSPRSATYVQALRNGYFDAIVLRYGPQRAWARMIEDELLAEQPRYRLAARLPFTLADGDGAYEIWVRADAPNAALVR